MSLGQQFREAREKKGVSIQKAAEDTKVRTDILQALEADDYSSMPAPVYAKGFLKIYAQYLGLDAQAVRAQFDEMSRASTPAAPLYQAATHLGQSPVDRIISSVATMWGLWALVGAILIVLVLIVWIVISATHRPRTASPASIPPPAVQPATVVTSKPADNPDAYIRPIQPRAGLLDAGKTNAAPKSAVPSPSAVPPAPLTVSVKLIEDSWIEVVVDGKTLPYHTQKAGWQKEWPAQKTVVLRVGNAGGVRVSRNGQELSPLGRHNQKAERTFAR